MHYSYKTYVCNTKPALCSGDKINSELSDVLFSSIIGSKF
jgi:hypothetical protein